MKIYLVSKSIQHVKELPNSWVPMDEVYLAKSILDAKEFSETCDENIYEVTVTFKKIKR